MESYHLVQRLRVDRLLEYIGLELTFRLLHTEGHIVARSDIFSVVETAAGSIGSATDLLLAIRARRRGGGIGTGHGRREGRYRR